MTYKQAKRKFKIETMGMYPFVLLGKAWGSLFPLKTKHSIFLLFPNADIGGAPKVNIDILHCVKDKKPLVIFTKKPGNNGFRERFEAEGARIIDLHKLIDKKIFHFINFFYRGILAAWINKSENPVLFGGECLFFYKLLPHLNVKVKCVELSHLDTWLPYNIGHIDRIDIRVFSTEELKKKVIKQYQSNSIRPELYEKLLFADNMLEIPAVLPPIENPKLEVIFIGRGSPQKRVHLIAAIAKEMHESGDRVHFSFVGDVEKIIPTGEFPFCEFYGNINDQEKLEAICHSSDVLILTSAFEGLPIVVMQMMSYGKIVVSTSVNGIPDYIKHMENGLLITAVNEEEIIREGISHLRLLINNPDLKKRLGEKNRVIAENKFDGKKFCSLYRKLVSYSYTLQDIEQAKNPESQIT